jgi:hypothetical protein
MSCSSSCSPNHKALIISTPSPLTPVSPGSLVTLLGKLSQNFRTPHPLPHARARTRAHEYTHTHTHTHTPH